jgi:hypothetical protein
MELPSELYVWLVEANVLSEYDAKARTGDKVVLESEASQQLELGLKMPALIKHLCQHKVGPALLCRLTKAKNCLWASWMH